jgi:hypothetical protein
MHLRAATRGFGRTSIGPAAWETRIMMRIPEMASRFASVPVAMLPERELGQ